jgi:hypothetical protein
MWTIDLTRHGLAAMLALPVSVGLGLVIGGCGGASTATHPTHASSSVTATQSTATSEASTTPSTAVYTKADGDKDGDFGSPDIDRPLNFGHAAGEPDRKMIATLVKRYYAAALAGDGAKACSMMYSTLAEATPEDYAVPGGPEYLQGAKTCQAVTSRLFRHFHAQLKVEVPKLQVSRVLLKERQGMVLLSFAALPRREIPVNREEHAWKIAALLDGELS